MSTDNNIRIVRSAYEAFQRGDIDGVLNTLAPNITWSSPGGPDLPWAGVRHGREEVGKFFAVLGGTLDFLEFEAQEFYASGDTVVIIGRDRVRVKGGDDIVEDAWAHVMRIRDDQVVDFREFADTAEIAAALRKVSVRVG